MSIAGLVLITPTSVSVTGGSSSGLIVGGGKVTFSTVETLLVNGVFSSSYDNYMVVGDITMSTSGVVNLQLAAAGTAATGSNYDHHYIEAASGTFDSARTTGATSMIIVRSLSVGAPAATFHLDLYAPALARPTVTNTYCGNYTNNATILDRTGLHNVSTAYDGFRLNTDTGTASGNLTIYGISQ